MKNYFFLKFNNILNMKWRLVFVLSCISCVLSFFFFNLRDLMSEYLIVNTIYVNDIEGFHNWLGIYFYDGQTYLSQMGIHGFLFSFPMFLGAHVSNFYIFFLIFTVTFLFYYILVSLAIEIKLQFNSLSSLFFLLVIFLNPIMLLNAGNLYWLYFIYILPFYFTLKYYGILKNNKFYFGLTLLFLLKFLVNFEYSSTVVISSIIPIALKSDYKFINGINKFLKNVLFVCCSSLVSFFIVILLLFGQISLNEERPFSTIEKVVKSYSTGSKNKPHFLNYENRIVEWNILYESIYKTNNEINKNNNGWDNVIEARDSYEGYKSILKYINFNGKNAMFYSFQFVIFMFIAVFLFIYFLLRFTIENSRFFYALLFAIFSSISWIVLMPLHFYLHSVYWRGISDVILIFPLYTTISILIGYIINKEYLKLKSNS